MLERLENWAPRSFGTWWHFLCLVAGMAAGYLVRPWMDRMAAAVRLWWEHAA